MKAKTTLAALISTAFLFSSPHGHAYFQPANPNSAQEMNGISLKQFKDFQKKWKLVTVRYRQDSGELRFTYANPMAYKVLQSLNPDYPKGAVFAKIGVRTQEDPSFPSSKVPSGAKRVQFMVRDAKKYADTDGWGYALFDYNGRVFEDEPIAQKTMACAACHRIVPERGYVFSRMMFIDPFAANSNIPSSETAAEPALKGVPFEKLNIPEVVAKIKSIPPPGDTPHRAALEGLKGSDYLYSITGELKKHAFSGTLDEIVPALLHQSASTKTPATLFLDASNYSLVFPGKGEDQAACPNSKIKAKMRILVVFKGKLVQDAKVCM